MPVTESPATSINAGRDASVVSRAEALFDVVPLAIALFDEELRLTRANHRYLDLTQTAAAPAGCPIYDAFPNALADLSDQIDVAAKSDTASTPVRIPFQHRSGQRVVEVAFLPMGARARGLVFVGNDVTEREQLREQLARSVEELETIFDVIPDAVRVFDADGVILRANHQAQLDHGPTPPKTLLELWQHDRPRSLDGTTLFMHEYPTARALKGESARVQTIAVKRGHEGTTAVIEVSSNPLRDAFGRIRGAVTVERDVTERTRLAQELEEQARRVAALYERVSTEAERLERMVADRTKELIELQETRSREKRLAAIGQLAAGVMHDVNNALNPIMAAAYLLEVHSEDPAAVREYAARIAKAAETGAATAARVGRFIRQEPLQGDGEEIVNLSLIAEEVIAMTRSMWAGRAQGGRIELTRLFSPGATISGISGEIREALLNLLHNALDAMRKGGTLTLVTGVAGNEAFIEVRDTGEGMTAEVRERAFEPFFSTKGSGGSGLGLSEVYGIAKRHRGHAEIESAPSRGTSVRLIFPLVVPAIALSEPVVSRSRVARRILLVEDNDDGRDFLRALLESDGHRVDAVATLHEAMERITAAASQPFDVLLTDIGLPDGSGWDLVSSAHGRWPAMRIGVVTGWEARPGPSGADFTLRKPVRAQELLALVGADAGVSGH